MKILHRLSLVLIALCSAIASWAQVSLTASAPTLVESGQRFNVAFTINAEPDDRTFEGPTFEGFDLIAGPVTSTHLSTKIINGVHSSSYSHTYTYTLVARDSGSFMVDRASIRVKGKEYKSEPLPIEVVEVGQNSGTAAVSNQDSVLLMWELSDSEVYKGEAVHASLKLYYKADVRNYQIVRMGTFDNFQYEQLDTNVEGPRLRYNGGVYDTFTIVDFLLVPQKSGTLQLPEVGVDFVVRVEVQDNYNAFYTYAWDDQVWYRRTSPISLTVKDLPEGAPASFKGAMGNFTMECKPPTTSVSKNGANEVSVTISGNGNLGYIEAPDLTMPDSFELYPPTPSDNTPNGNSGRVTYTYPFMARAEGEFEISGVEFTYFDPSAGEYVTLNSEPFTITVVEGDARQGRGGARADYFDNANNEKHIRHIYTGDLPIDKVSFLIFSPTYWIAVFSLIAIFVAVFYVMRQRIRANRNIVMRRMKHADKVAIKRLRMAKKSMKEGNRHSFYREILSAMWGYISDKFNIPVSDLTKVKIREELSRRGVDSEVYEQVCNIISRADEAQYAPVSDDDMKAVYADAVDVLSKIESVVKH